MAKATFAAGCFWGVEDVFRQVPGVIDAISGYTGGHADQPTYHQVCSDTTGHAEAVEVTYDPSKISFEELAEVFFEIHDPTQLNRQGPDIGSQYRSAIFFHDAEQEVAAHTAKAATQTKRSRPVVTEIVPASPFWPAEEYHQRYFEKKGMAGCHVLPAGLREKLAAKG